MINEGNLAINPPYVPADLTRGRNLPNHIKWRQWGLYILVHFRDRNIIHYDRVVSEEGP